ncbi:MAG: glycosyltransferase family 4 protein [Lentisphaerae bacterium]|nr:glycosyltransferase family 4 protein [Lentisphaerota bacterium]
MNAGSDAGPARPARGTAVIVVENSYVPLDTRVTYEAATLRDAGWRTIVICPDPAPAGRRGAAARQPWREEDFNGVTVCRFPLAFAARGIGDYLAEYVGAFTRIARLTWRIWRRTRFDVLQFCNPPDIFFPLALFYRLLGAGVVFDQHDLFPEMVRGRYGGLTGSLFYAAARVTEWLTARSANVVITTNESYRRTAVSRNGVPEGRIMVMRNGPRAEDFAPVPPLPELKRGHACMACYVGVMGEEDGVTELVAAIRRIAHEMGRRDIFFALVGDGAARDEALAAVRQWRLEDLVDMPGLIHDRLRLRQYMCTADVLVSPEPNTPLNALSTFVKVGEYMAMGKPLVATDLTETRYTAQDAALYVEPGNVAQLAAAIVRLVDDPDLRRRMGAAGRARVLEHLCWERQQEKLLQAYEKARSRRG